MKVHMAMTCGKGVGGLGDFIKNKLKIIKRHIIRCF
jgi:hypothetical protein